MARTQKNKATSKHLGQLKAKLAKLKQEVLTGSKVLFYIKYREKQVL